MLDQISPSKTISARDVLHAFEARADKDRLDALVAPFKSLTSSSTATVVVSGFLFYTRVSLVFEGAPPPTASFDGEGGGFVTIVASVARGELYTSDSNRLFATTTGFSYAFAGPLLQLWFWDASSNLLGYYEGVGGGTLNGFAGGKGSWRIG